MKKYILIGCILCIGSMSFCEDGPPPVKKNNSIKISYLKWNIPKQVKSPHDEILFLKNTLDDTEQKNIRYLSMYNFPDEMRDDVYKCVCFVLNSLNIRGQTIIKPEINSTLIKINLDDFNLSLDVWDKLNNADPYFYSSGVFSEIKDNLEKSKVEISVKASDKNPVIINGTLVESGYKFLMSGLTSDKEEEYVLSDNKGKVFLKLKLKPGQSANIDLQKNKIPIMRADFFIVNALQDPWYYSFLGITKLNDFLDAVGFDRRSDTKDIRATIINSGLGAIKVTQHNRIIGRQPTFNGYLWQTFDFAESTGLKNVVNNFLMEDSSGKKIKRDAGEYIASGANGLQFYALVNDKEELVSEGDIKIVRDKNFEDGRVINGRSCVVCHSSGINYFESYFQKCANNNVLKNKSASVQRIIESKFLQPDFSDVIEEDQRKYAKVIAKVNGLLPEENARIYKIIWIGYNNFMIDSVRAMYETGLTENQLKDILIENNFLSETEKINIRRDHWEEFFRDKISKNYSR